MQSEVVIAVEGLVKRYGEFEALRGIEFEVGRGEVFGFVGPNGAGKTTTIECIVGLRSPTEGTVRVLGLDPAASRPQTTAHVAVQTQSASLFDTLSVIETLRLFGSFHKNPLDPDHVVHQVGLQDERDHRSKNLSGGQARRLLLGVALVGDPEIVVLDEPSAGLDPAARQNLWMLIAALRKRGVTVLLSTHDMEEATSLCDRVAILVAGRVAALGSPAELVRQRSAESTVSFTVPTNTNLDSLAALAEPGGIVTSVIRGAVRVTIATSDPDRVLRRVTFEPSVKASEFDIRNGTLEDIFIELAQEQQSERGKRPTASASKWKKARS
ncbi:ABC transporter ATP-binding protein [Subtercola endophyticus]|uniref:ABC transporter ATP-binding protein n=1 Tax=Subtercola endophyticus TaxID=2895559 RepID=UPI001E4978E8|nr:ABC transporter ATP-binding protein [Subtercola endophyticus]UFS57587.1 ABC transporter ATP-binding protein [Subtercola endophyticus]